MGFGFEKRAFDSTRRQGLTGVLWLVACVSLLLFSSSSFAAFTRPLLPEVTGASTGSFNGLGGVAVDAEDNLWVGDGLSSLDEFSPAYGSSSNNLFIKTLSVVRPPEVPPMIEEHPTPPESVAISHSTGYFYFTGAVSRPSNEPYVEVLDNTGKFNRKWPVTSGAHIAIDNSAEPLLDPGAGSVYVASLNGGAVSKFSESGVSVGFSFKVVGPGFDYVHNGEIVGTPSGAFAPGSPAGVTADSEGDIFVVYPAAGEVDEYRSSGEFVRAFVGNETPGLGESKEYGGFGGELSDVAFDGVDDHLLVSLDRYNGLSGVVEVGAVDEFDLVSGRFVGQITEASGGGSLHSAFEMTVDSHGDLYVVDSSGQVVDVYGPGRFVPSVSPGEVVNRTGASVVLDGSVNPESGVNPETSGLSECYFQFVSESAFNANVAQGEEGFATAEKASCVPSAGDIKAVSESQAVHADIGGLVSGTTYDYRLVATTSGLHGGTSASPLLGFTTPHAPVIDSTSASNLSSSFADLDAQIDPLGATTFYYFQYVGETHYDPGSEDPYADGMNIPVSAESIGSGGPTGGSVETVLQHVGGLLPGSTYDFRVVAENDVEGKPEIVDGPDKTFTTLPGAIPGLPDNRAYELVTPSDKIGGSDMFGLREDNNEYFNVDVGQPSESGNGFLLETYSAFGPFPASGHNAYVFSREASGWSYSSLASLSLGVQGITETIFDPADLSLVGLNDSVGSAASESGERLTSFFGPPAGPYTTLHTDASLHASELTVTAGENTRIVGASRNLGSIILQSTTVAASKSDPLCPGAESQDEGSHVLCEWTGGFEEELKPELKLINTNSTRCGALLGAGDYSGQTRNAVSADGSRLIFTAPDPTAKNKGSGCWNPATGANSPQLYMRTNSGSIIQLSAPEEGVSDPTGSHRATYVGASEDDSRVFFLSEAWLTRDHPQTHDLELYECEVVEEADGPDCKLTRISAGEPGAPGAVEGANLNTVPAVSSEGTAVYFTAFGALTSGSSPHPVPSGEGPVNLYRYDSINSTVDFVAEVSTNDYIRNNACGGQLEEVALCPDASWYTTPDGRYLLFASAQELTGYSTLAPGRCVLSRTQGASNGHCEELYRYDAVTGRLACVSCDPSGEAPVSNALFSRSALTTPEAGPPRAMSNDGSYVFFDTADPLVSSDNNHTLDVYEWHNGHVSLISSGKDSSPSFFLGASSNGANVFIGTHANLVPEDTDSNGDIYDVRICEPEEGDPCIKPPSGETAQCEGDTCQSNQLAPVYATPGSITISGAGNVITEVKSTLRAIKLTSTQRLVKALKKCKRKPRRRREKCEKQARKNYGTKPKNLGKGAVQRDGILIERQTNE